MPAWCPCEGGDAYPHVVLHMHDKPPCKIPHCPMLHDCFWCAVYMIYHISAHKDKHCSTKCGWTDPVKHG